MSEPSAESKPTPGSRAEPVNPFIGAESFRTGDKIFGRDREIEEFATRLLARRVVLLHSPSGAGKTSLVQAGVIPALNRKGVHILPKVRLNNQLPDEQLPAELKSYNRYLASLLLSLDAGEGIPEEAHLSYTQIAELSLKPDGVREYLEAHAPYAKGTRPRRHPGKSKGIQRSLIFFDQFEEVLTLDSTDAKAKKDFFARIAPLLNDYSSVAIFAMREEFVAELEPYLIYIPERLSARFRLELLGKEAAMDAIGKPAQRVHVRFERKGAELLVERLSQVTVLEGGQEIKKGGQFVEPVQLQVVCRDLFERRENPNQITKLDVEKQGSIEDALGAYYNKKVKEVALSVLEADPKQPEKAVETERKLRDWIEKELIVSGRLRGQAIAGEESNFGLEKGAIDRLIQAFIVREEPRRGLVWYELAHDSLVRPVVSSNQAWRELHASEFEIQAARWHKAPESERERLLPAGEALRQAVAWGEAHLESLSDLQKDYLSAARREMSRMDVRQDNRAELGLNLEDTGWGVIFAAAAPSTLREALKELLTLRQSQAGRKRSTYYREFFGTDGYRPGETAQRFLTRWDAGSGLANPEKMPYYLLIVGDPAEIPFEFQYGLDVQYAVGRIYFETLEEYTRYASSVVLSETKHAEGSFDLPNSLTVFAPQNPDDQATKLSMDYLVGPLLDTLPDLAPNWDVQSLIVEHATKANLRQVLGGGKTPALLFTASHAMGWPMGDARQLDQQGALVCQDWPGPNYSRGAIPPEAYFSAADIAEEAGLLGTIVISYGSYIAGTPREDNFGFYNLGKPQQVAEKPFLARLPQRLLSAMRGGVLAIVAHVDRAWGHSFIASENPLGQRASDTGPYAKLLTRLMQGSTVGMAMEDLNRRYSFFNTSLTDELIGINFYGSESDPSKLAQMMTQTIDARNYILIGDPAARLPVRADRPYQAPPAGWQRPVIGAVSPPAVPEGQPEEPVAVPGPELLVEVPNPPTPAEEAAAPEAATQTTGGLPGVSVDSLASALIKGQKLKLGDYK